MFILSPASCSGERARLVLNERASFDLALRLRSRQGASLGETFSFLSGLYFRGKLAYARAFARPRVGADGILIITTNRGLLPADMPVTLEDLRAMARGCIDPNDATYRQTLQRDAASLATSLGRRGQAILLGSIATGKYVEILHQILGSRLLFPREFIGRGDMSRGGLLLRCVDDGCELTYIRVGSESRRGRRPPKLAKRRRPKIESGSGGRR